MKPSSNQDIWAVQWTHFRLYKYKLTYNEYMDMLEIQEYCCAICGRQFGEACIPQVDHDHKTGYVRGLLCGPCNSGLGMFQDEPRLLARALVYIEDANNGRARSHFRSCS